jgi:DNA helicase II / ATP-dependent DNA helicase PcrA
VSASARVLHPASAASWTPGQLARILDRPEPTSEQAAVIAAPLEPGVVVAGAGSGKSETMAARVVWLVANGHVRPEHVLGLTFTRKAAGELAERVRERLEALRTAEVVDPSVLDGEAEVSTYHAYASRIVGDHALREAVEPTVRLITQAVAWQLARQVVGEFDGDMDAVANGPADVTQAVLELGGELAEHLADPEDVREVGRWLRKRAAALPKQLKPTKDALAVQQRREQLLPLVERFQRAKAVREVMDFGDQITLATRIARNHPEVGLIERDRFHVVLLDEFQDTSHAQLLLLRTLFGDGHPVTAVGDPCQSIYGWRGASAGNLAAFPTEFPLRPGVASPVRRLAVSFRNGERILDLATRISAPLRAEDAKAGTGTVPVLHPGPDRRGRGTVSCGLFHTDLEEAEWIAERIAHGLSSPLGDKPGAQGAAGLTAGDVAVLCRKRSQFPVLRAALERRGIPVEVVGLGGLMTVAEVRDVVATLRVLHDPTAGTELVRLLTSRRWRLGPRDLVALGARAQELAEATRRDLDDQAPEPEVEVDLLRSTLLDLTAERGSLLDALHEPGPAEHYSAAGYERITRLAQELRGLRDLQSLPELITEIERVHGLDIEVAARPGPSPAAARADLEAFAEAASRFVGTSEDPSLGSFLAYLSAAEDNEHGLEGGRVGAGDTVKLMTAHGAKGLQWPLVVVPGLCGGTRAPLFPAKPVRTSSWLRNERRLPFPLRGDHAALPRLEEVDKPGIEAFDAENKAREQMEERRLFYVALTRAAEELVCTGHWWGEAASPRGPSVFLEEVREACAVAGGRIIHWEPAPEEGEANPRLADPEPVPWPRSEAEDPDTAADHARNLAAAALVAEARDGAGERWLRPVEEGPAEEGAVERAELPEGRRRRLEGWARDAELLLAHRDQRAERARTGEQVVLPASLSVSTLMQLHGDPDALAQRIRRPMPRPPAPHTRRGTAFHTWLESRHGQAALLGPEELPGAADDSVDGEEAVLIAEDFERLRANFEAGEWASRVPIEVEVPFETVIAGHLVRGRMDAIFDTGEGHEVVDWKTGRVPSSAAERRAAEVQLAAYRLAWAGLAGVEVERVSAAFYYVRADTTIRPADLLDAEGLAELIRSVPTG